MILFLYNLKLCYKLFRFLYWLEKKKKKKKKKKNCVKIINIYIFLALLNINIIKI